ncbi:hypothetical protein J40TS1_51270 [Paenibacillus montaniterrae]|uniref:Uncharacterized protein n=1 Tax=Paenibacillus montaniterrae TaxID=429341 RepID=A0A919YTM6_9BACL|nr:hypothetical protein [Paenibacillus montaniterrae]GIP19485.1 hypothetical protein J40TS1_51270 [Paenibacillus montaniterrae]
MKISRLAMLSFSLLLLLTISSSYVFAEQLNSKEVQQFTQTAKSQNSEELQTEGKRIELYNSIDHNAAMQLANKVYSETPFIKLAPKVNENDIATNKAANYMPYYFDFSFNASLTSQTITNNTAGTVRITATGSWDDYPNYYSGTQYDYYDITLYAGSQNLGTHRFLTGSWRHADWDNVPTGNIYFVMTKSFYTYSGAPYPGYNGTITGSGAALNN